MGEGPRRRGVRGMVEKGGGRGRGSVVSEGVMVMLVEGIVDILWRSEVMVRVGLLI
jgi:hypothetical protein